jgi:hypothetical protein
VQKGSTPAAVKRKPHGSLRFWNWGFQVLQASLQKFWMQGCVVQNVLVVLGIRLRDLGGGEDHDFGETGIERKTTGAFNTHVPSRSVVGANG